MSLSGIHNCLTDRKVCKRDELGKEYGWFNRLFTVVFDTIRHLMAPPVAKKRKIGFKSEGGRRRPGGCAQQETV